MTLKSCTQECGHAHPVNQIRFYPGRYFFSAIQKLGQNHILLFGITENWTIPGKLGQLAGMDVLSKSFHNVTSGDLR